MTAQLLLAGRQLRDPLDSVRRYCGLPWSGGSSETWAWRYFDEVPSTVGPIDRIDVLATAALHPGLSRTDLAFFAEQSTAIDQLIARLPTDLDLADASPTVIEIAGELGRLDVPVSMTLLAKAAHRKRPRLLPLVDKHILDWYRPVTGERSGRSAWPRLLDALRSDLDSPANREALGSMRETLAAHLAMPPSAIRLVDIAIWMDGLR